MKLSPSAGKVLAFLKSRAVNGIADVRQREIVASVAVSWVSLHAVLRRLEALGLIETVRAPEDRREVRYRIPEIVG